MPISRFGSALVYLLLLVAPLLAGQSNSVTRPLSYPDCLRYALDEHRKNEDILRVPSYRAIMAETLSLDGSLMAVGIADSFWSTLAAFDTASGRQLWRADVSAEPGDMQLSPDGRLLAVTYAGYTICGQTHLELREARTGIKLVNLENRAPSSNLLEDYVAGIAFSPDGTMVAAQAGSEMRLWDIATGKNHFSFMTTEDDASGDTRPPRISSLSFSPDGKLLLGTGPTHKIFLWRVRDGRFLKGFRYVHDINGYGTVMFSPDGKWLAAESYGPIRIWRIADGALAGSLDTGIREFLLGITQDGKQVVTETNEESGPNHIEVWDATRPKRGKPLFSYELSDSIGHMLPSGRIILGGPAKTAGVQLTDLDTGRKLSTLIMPERAPEPWFHQGAPQQTGAAQAVQDASPPH